MVTTKWWFGLFILYISVAILCLVTEGSSLGTDETSVLNALTSSGADDPGAIFDLVYSCIVWKFSFFQTGIGVWIKLPLMMLSAAVMIPLAFEVFRLIFKPFGG